jgi:photosystem II stability/assembly factor-like uncharacterized protein
MVGLLGSRSYHGQPQEVTVRLPALVVLVPTALFSLSPAVAKTGKRANHAAQAEQHEKEDVLSAKTFAGLELRSIGPAVTSGRVTDFAVDPSHPERFYVAAASGGVWRTVNDGTTWTPVFDDQGAYSIGCLALDPSNPHTLWVGTGENNSQRSVSWGDGVYRSDDDGKNWTTMGLKHSEHIGRIVVDPRDSSVVYVAAQGPLWTSGGDRGLYKTTDGGATWTCVLSISENTGVNEVWIDPRNPDVLYATAYQRRRHVWTLIDGGPESAIYKSTDAGKTWRKVDKGLPKVDLGRIGLAVSPADPDVIYAIVEAADDKGGVFRSDNRGESWDKRSDYMSTSPQYYNELVADPEDVDTVYAMDTWMHVSHDGGKTFTRVGEKSKHVDNHALWIERSNPAHLLAGCDGGVYESRDRAATWEFKANLPITQFYRVDVDDAQPFYNVYGGTQDNNTLGGPSRTKNVNGILDADWFVVTGGDGFVARVDPKDPDVVYGESQYGGLVRFDRRSGEEVDIQPQEDKAEAPNRWNWDSPVIVSPHDHTRLYVASQRVYRSDNRGDTWREISGDLSRHIDRDTLKVMGRVWPTDAVAKSDSTSFYGNVVALAESAKVEGLLYAGTDDGLVQVTEDAGEHWRKVEAFPGVPPMTYVAGLTPSVHDADTVYATFDNHKNGDFKPYVLKSTDRGRTWTSIVGNLPKTEVAYTLREDPGDASLLFLGCEFGLYFSADAGVDWVKLTGGMPTIAVRDIAVQSREHDLALATFGRGFYILDDYTPLRGITREKLGTEALLFPVRDALAYIEAQPLGGRHKSFQGDALYTADNPPFGATFTYYLKDTLETAKERRHDAEKEAAKKGETPHFPTIDELRAEEREAKPEIVLTVSDPAGNVVREVAGPVKKGFHRVAWDLRFPPATPASLKKPSLLPWDFVPRGPLVAPGEYRVTLAKRVAGVTTPLAAPLEFKVVPLNLNALAAHDREALLGFEHKVARLQRAALGARDLVRDTAKQLDLIRAALTNVAGPSTELLDATDALTTALGDLRARLTGDDVRAKHNVPATPGIVDRVQRIVDSEWSSTSAPTDTQRTSYAVAADEFTDVLARLRKLVDVDLKALNATLEKVGAPWTPGRVPEWTKE